MAVDPFYTQAIAKAEALIQKYGRSIDVIRNQGPTASDADRPWDTDTPTDEPQTVHTFGVFTSFKRKTEDDTDVKVTSKKLIFVATGIDWELSSKDIILETDSTLPTYNHQYITVEVLSITPGPISVLYELQVRRG